MIDLDLAYLIRADAIAFLNGAAGGNVTTADVVAGIRRLHPKLSVEEIRHLAERVAACWGQTGFDYEEAALRADGAREWYPVRRDGRLQRMPIEAIGDDDLDFVFAEMARQEEARRAHSGPLRAARGAGR